MVAGAERPGSVDAGRSAGPPTGSPLAAPFSIGTVEIPNRVVLAPMAGLTSSAYRRHLKAHGAGLVTTEMVSAYGLFYRNVRTGDYLDFTPEERPVAVQLFGDTPEVMVRAAEAVLSRPMVPDILDINMGCPVRKVVKTGAGAALLGDPERAVAMAGGVVRAAAQAGIPVTVKIRSGLRPGERVAVDLAPRLEQVGVQALGVHPRAASEYYRGTADHAVTAAVVQAVAIPVVASGDMVDVDSALAVVESTGAAAVMAARGVAGNPWLVGALLSGRSAARPPLAEVVEDLRRLLALAVEERGPRRAAPWMRKLLGWYLRPSGVEPAAIEHLRTLPDAEALDEALRRLLAEGS
jgi:tRNA-dihydrouridine synthase B